MQEFLKAGRIKDVVVGWDGVVDVEFVNGFGRGGFGGWSFGLFERAERARSSDILELV
jgi:hypothetical protein